MSKLIDLTGQKFGKLTVLKRSETKNKRTMWLCECDCGNRCNVRSDKLRSNKTMSCGCAQRENASIANFKNEIGKKYGFLTVIRPLYEKNDNGETMWECQCDCGNKTIVRGSLLRSGHTKSCGCYQKNIISSIAIKDEIGNRYGKLTVIEYAGIRNGKALWKCKCDCGNDTFVCGVNLRYGDTLSCGCLNSKNEMIIKQILSKYQIQYTSQKTFDDCRDTLPLPFDVYLPEYNICIEYDGMQHFQPVEHFGGISSFEIIQKHDKIKSDYCNKNKIELWRINYNDNVEAKLLELLSKYVGDKINCLTEVAI